MNVQTLQIVSAIVWGLITLLLVPAFIRSFGSKELPTDKWKAILFFVGILFSLAPARWVIMPDHNDSWKILYLVGIILGLYVMYVLWKTRKT